jgi:L-alanine-DL-glutamate epimerase-like enolase superfamily enzyme
MNFDSTRAGGVTKWLRIASYCLAHGVLMTTHRPADSGSPHGSHAERLLRRSFCR